MAAEINFISKTGVVIEEICFHSDGTVTKPNGLSLLGAREAKSEDRATVRALRSNPSTAGARIAHCLVIRITVVWPRQRLR
jgi:hypothetical protein